MDDGFGIFLTVMVAVFWLIPVVEATIPSMAGSPRGRRIRFGCCVALSLLTNVYWTTLQFLPTV